MFKVMKERQPIGAGLTENFTLFLRVGKKYLINDAMQLTKETFLN